MFLAKKSKKPNKALNSDRQTAEQFGVRLAQR